MMTKVLMAAVLAAGLPMAALASDEQYVSQMPPPSTLTLLQMDALTQRLVPMPDKVLAVVLPASTFPVEIVMAERWVAAHPEATAADIDGQAWPEPVRALAHDPATLKMMSDELEWTQALGKAFLAQGDDVLRAVQRSRIAAHKASTLTIVKGETVTQMDGGVQYWPASTGSAGAEVTQVTQVIPPVSVEAVGGYGVGGTAVYNTAVYGGADYGCDWGNYVIVDGAGVDWRYRLGAVGVGRGRDRGGVATILNGPGISPVIVTGGGFRGGYGGGYGGVVYQPGYTGNVIVTSGPQTLYGAPTFQRTGYSFTAPLIASPGIRIVGGGRR